MADLFDALPQVGILPTAGAAVENAPTRGRPKGAKGKRSGDLAKILVAEHDGRTPGQDLAAICMPTSADRREARRRAKALGVRDVDMLANIVKAENVAKALGHPVNPITGRPGIEVVQQVFGMLFKVKLELMPYVHQRLAPKEGEKPADQIPIIYMDPEPAGGALPPSAFGESEEDQGVIEVVPLELTHSNSHE